MVDGGLDDWIKHVHGWYLRHAQRKAQTDRERERVVRARSTRFEGSERWRGTGTQSKRLRENRKSVNKTKIQYKMCISHMQSNRCYSNYFS